MHLNRYPYSVSDTFLDFEFESKGPNGTIKKVVRYSPQNSYGLTYFNLGFGDLDTKSRSINDLSKSNNSDSQKILATIAATVIAFTSYFPDAIIYARGSTPARTRLYQMGISRNWKAVNDMLHVYGYTNGGWQLFSKNVNYEAFLVLRQ